MDSRWQFAREVWQASFAPLVDAGYRLERIDDAEAYFDLHERELRDVFPPEYFFDLHALRPEGRRVQLARLKTTRDDKPLLDFCAVYQGDALAAMFCGHQYVSDAYRMWHANVAPPFRRQGLYRQVVRSTIAYTDELGFMTVVSEHAPGNNPVLIAKLSEGFRITSMSVEPTVGVSVHLTYFHSKDEFDVFRHRTGLATLSPKIVAAGMGAIDRLREQLSSKAP